MTALAALVLAAGGAVTAPTQPPSDVDGWARQLSLQRGRFTQWLLQSPTSYLAAVQRVDFGDRTELLVGRAPGADVRLDDPAVAPRHLRVTVTGDTFRVEALDETARFQAPGGETRRAESLPPTGIEVGRYTLRLSHQGFPAIIVFDPKSPHFTGAPSPAWWPLDPAYRVVAKLEPAPKREEVTIQSTRGTPRKALRVGTLVFTLHGRQHRLEADRLLEPGVGEHAISVFFRDATTGKESYPVGRYVDPVPQGDDTYVLDFNAAYNPACAWSPHYNCPIPPRANRLSIRIEAGDKSPKSP